MLLITYTRTDLCGEMSVSDDYKKAANIYGFSAQDIDGQEVSMEKYRLDRLTSSYAYAVVFSFVLF